MVDDVTINPGAGGAKIAADDIDGKMYQRFKPGFGDDGVYDGDVSAANPLPVAVSANGQQNMLLYRYLDTVGNGSGTKNANGDYSGGVTTFALAPPAATIYRVARMIVSIGDEKEMRADGYGAIVAALTNGIQVRIHNGSDTVLDLTDGVPIKTNTQWGAACYDVEPKTFGAGPNGLLVVRWTFTKAGQFLRLDGTANEELQVVLNDNLTALISHYFFAQGYIESSGT